MMRSLALPFRLGNKIDMMYSTIDAHGFLYHEIDLITFNCIFRM